MTGAVTVLVPDAFGADVLVTLPGVHPVVYGGQADRATIAAATRFAEVLVVSLAAREEGARLLPALPRLRLVQALSAGLERWRPLVPDGVTLAGASGANGAATAELAVASLLAVLREIPRAVIDQAHGRWTSRTTDGLDGKRVLVLGAGDIGREVRNRVVAFGATVTMVGRTAREGVLALDAIDDVLPDHDVVIVALPLSDRTAGLIGRRFLAALPDGAVLVNVARGGIVDTDALLEHLHAGRLRAALDVTDPEPPPPGHPLWTSPNLLLTPHLGGSTHGWRRRSWAVVADQIGRYLAGQPLRNVAV